MFGWSVIWDFMTHGRVGVKVAAILDLCKFEGVHPRIELVNFGFLLRGSPGAQKYQRSYALGGVQ